MPKEKKIQMCGCFFQKPKMETILHYTEAKLSLLRVYRNVDSTGRGISFEVALLTAMERRRQ